MEIEFLVSELLVVHSYASSKDPRTSSISFTDGRHSTPSAPHQHDRSYNSHWCIQNIAHPFGFANLGVRQSLRVRQQCGDPKRNNTK
ncbi:hypothetical protein IG631_15167 [Alternaria alternata]|nr:hypothetical protein IG631_15167 [Alternaria alternata]